MDQHYQYQRFVYDLTRKYFLLGRSHLVDNLKPEPDDRVLELGCGTGRNLINVAKRYNGVALFGIDISHLMLQTARSSINRNQFTDRIRLAPCDATLFSGHDTFAISQFNRIFISFALSMIDDWENVVNVGVQHLAIGGQLHIVDFGDCNRFPSIARKPFFAFLRHYQVTPRSQLKLLCQRLANQYGLEMHYESLHRGYVSYAILTRGQ